MVKARGVLCNKVNFRNYSRSVSRFCQAKLFLNSIPFGSQNVEDYTFWFDISLEISPAKLKFVGRATLNCSVYTSMFPPVAGRPLQRLAAFVVLCHRARLYTRICLNSFIVLFSPTHQFCFIDGRRLNYGYGTANVKCIAHIIHIVPTVYCSISNGWCAWNRAKLH